MFFFGWLGAKMYLPEGVGDWWWYASLVVNAIQLGIVIFVPNKYLK
jgi:hypothetical protein